MLFDCIKKIPCPWGMIAYLVTSFWAHQEYLESLRCAYTVGGMVESERIIVTEVQEVRCGCTNGI